VHRVVEAFRFCFVFVLFLDRGCIDVMLTENRRKLMKNSGKTTPKENRATQTP
jgi:hypothetical protein